MRQEIINDGTVEMFCPFCNSLIVEAHDFSELELGYVKDNEDDDDSEEEEDEELDYWDIHEQMADEVHTFCDHVAFLSDWDYSSHTISQTWGNELKKIAKAIELEQDPFINEERLKIFDRDYIDDPSSKGFADSVDGKIEDIINSYLHGCDSNEELSPLFEKTLPEIDYSFIRERIQKDGGLKGNDVAIYLILFLCKK